MPEVNEQQANFFLSFLNWVAEHPVLGVFIITMLVLVVLVIKGVVPQIADLIKGLRKNNTDTEKILKKLSDSDESRTARVARLEDSQVEIKQDIKDIKSAIDGLAKQVCSNANTCPNRSES